MIPLQRSMSRCCFVYGTLMSKEVLQTLLGRLPEMDPRPAYLPPEYSRHPVKGRVFPAVILHRGDAHRDNKAVEERVGGILLSGISSEELKILDWFEDTAYDRCSVPVSLLNDDCGVETEIVEADVYLWNAGAEYLDLDSSWDFEEFCTEKLSWYLRSTVRPCKEEYGKR